ncbi:hypothetical protein IMG5_123710 [Ichthyophthirius multifiliis]|uniref:CS domain-containing protein n=1 Tax=Ichthyophthirius multifiliis TaxID=5932 RepID=G0QVH4_ICHMU|nr:hypothetical protein IMG5_123710 [Ichthyophthirius multifiliis]EGR30784.1 hypothetical protein IMG5_123710 [Ichthyophthirius multifiliis]|eukprot:XP_004032371.1 hypothetical protein IMG5_123710 [Ichthyophthirius multifiliis]
MTHILMKIKFSTRLDMPGYSEVHRLNITITLPELYIEAIAFTGDNPIKFKLNIKTYKFMNQYYSKWHQTEMGTIVLEILKSPSPYVWKNIHSDENYNPPNQYIWWSAYYQYRNQMEAGFQLLDDSERRKEDQYDLEYNKQEKLIEDKKILKIKIQEQTNQIEDQYRNLMYCTQYIYKEGNFIGDPFDWISWEI